MEANIGGASDGREARRAGVLVRGARGRQFVPAEVARKIASRPTVTPVPGTEFGMALIDGQVVSVIDVGGPQGTLLLCEAEGQLLALSGLSVERSGFWDGAPGGVRVGDEIVPELDVCAIARALSRKIEPGPGETERSA